MLREAEIVTYALVLQTYRPIDLIQFEQNLELDASLALEKTRCHMNELRNMVELVIKAFALGLFVTIILNWVAAESLAEARRKLNKFYDIFLEPIRRYIKPVRFSPSAPVGLDLSPLILLALVWWFIHPFLMWILG